MKNPFKKNLTIDQKNDNNFNLDRLIKTKKFTKEGLLNVLNLAIDALALCNTIQQDTGISRIALSDLAKEIGKGITTEQIRDCFHILVALEIIQDDGDYDYMNYDEDLPNTLKILKNQLSN